MPVNSVHCDYEKASPWWKKCRDAYDGEEAVKKAGAAYLPRLEGMKNEDYDAYKMRAEYYNATRRTVQGLRGAVMRKPPSVKVPGDDTFLESIGSASESLDELLREAVKEALVTSRIGHLVDAPEDAAAAYIVRYPAEDIINWRERNDPVTGRRRLSMVVLRECSSKPDPEDTWKHEEVIIYRVLKLGTGPAFRDAEGRETTERSPNFTEREVENAFYFQEEWEEDKTKDEKDPNRFRLLRTITPRKRGGGLFNEIPFTITNADNMDSAVSAPVLLDLVNVNLSHYRTSADLEHGRHYTALPTPWVAGFDMKGAPLRIGAGTAWVTDNSQARAGMLEFTGAGLNHLSEGMRDKEKRMAVLGARMLDEQQKAAEAAETLKLRQSGESSALSNISMVIGQTFEQLITWVLEFTGTEVEDDKVEVALNTDFAPAGMDSATLLALFGALQSNAISWNTWIYQLTKGEILPAGVTAEDEAQLIVAGPPGGVPGAVPAGSKVEEEEPEAGSGE